MSTERGQAGGPPYAIEDDPAIAVAREIAWSERADKIDERHVLLAILKDRNSGTMREIIRSLGEQPVKDIDSAAWGNRPKCITSVTENLPPIFPGAEEA